MINWKNLDTLVSYKELFDLGEVDLAEVMTEKGMLSNTGFSISLYSSGDETSLKNIYNTLL